MNPIIVILIVSISIWSLFTTCKAIYLIITQDFRGNKMKWILISMIGIIGPIFWILFGKDYLNTENNSK